MTGDKKMFRLKGKVQHYDWGGHSFIPTLLGIKNVDQGPFAEYWLGAHVLAPSEVAISKTEFVPLDKLINTDPDLVLGDEVAKKYHMLPYLLKVLDVKNMLSIQVHPSRQAAEKDFSRENELGIPLNSKNRNYKDTNHKPELAMALGDFWLLHGFKPEQQLATTLQSTPELKTFHDLFKLGGYQGLYKTVMEMPQDEVNYILQPLLNRLIPLYQQNKLQKDTADFWAARAALTFNKPGSIDRGIFSVYFFNLVHLNKGQAIFQDAGVPHAYLEGSNVEIMANSDNVLRGGLTTKYIDVKELLKHTKCEVVYPEVINPKITGKQEVFETPAPDFELSAYQLRPGESTSFTANTCEIILVLDGEIELQNSGETLLLSKGESAIIFAGGQVTALAKSQAELYRASVPSHNH